MTSPLMQFPISELSQSLFPAAPELSNNFPVKPSKPLEMPKLPRLLALNSPTSSQIMSEHKHEKTEEQIEDERISISDALFSSATALLRPQAKNQKRRKKSAFKINKQMLVRIYLDEASWNTIVIKNSTTVNDIVRKICWKRSLDPNQSSIWCDDEVLQGDQILYPIISKFSNQGLQPVFSFYSPQSELTAGEGYMRDVFFSNSSTLSNSSTRSLLGRSSENRTHSTVSLGTVSDEHVFSIPTLARAYSLSPRAKPKIPQSIIENRKMNSSRMEVLQTFSIVPNLSGSEDEEKEKEKPLVGDFDVIKINNRGRRQKRILRITELGVENIKNSSYVSSKWDWSSVITVFRKDTNQICFKVKEKKDRRDRVYETKEAGKLLVAIQRHIERHNKELDAMAARDMSQKIHKRILHEEVHGNRETVKSVKSIKRKISEKLERPEQERSRIATRVDSWLQNRKSNFSRYISSFLGKWHKSYRKEDDCLEIVRSFMDQLKDVIISRELSFLSSLAFPNKPIDDLSDDEHDFINIEIDKSIEQHLIPQLLDDLLDHLNRKNDASTKVLEQNCDKLQNKGIEFYQCSKDVLEISSLHNWDAAVMELTKLPRAVFPSMKLLVISDTIGMIYSLASASRLEDSKTKFLSGDDILPICIYVIVQATKSLKNLCYSFADHQFIDQLISRDTLKGETEYYLTVFEACLCHLADNMSLK